MSRNWDVPSPHRPLLHGRCAQNGVTFVAVLLLLALCMLGLAIAGPLWSQQVKREREQELMRIGSMYAKALAAYHEASPGSLKQYPLRLDALLMDTRYIGIKRHLRKLYADPIDPRLPWGLVLDAERRIVGVYSQSREPPIAEGSIEVGGVLLMPAKHYADWKFVIKVNQ